MKHLAEKPVRKASVPSLFGLRAAVIVLVALLHCLAFADEGSDFSRARAAASAADSFEAQSLLEDYIDRYPEGSNAPNARYLLGRILYRRADYSGAAQAFSAIIEQHPQWKYIDKVAYGLAMAQLGMLDSFGAKKTLETLIESHPDSEIAAEALYWLAECLYGRSDYAEALARFNKFMQRYPEHPLRENALDSAAWCLEQLGRYAEAIAARETFLAEFPAGELAGAAEFHLADDYLNEGDRLAAAQHYMSAASATTPLGEKALLRAGLLLAEAGRMQEAIRALEQFLEKEPAREAAEHARAALGNCYLKTGDYKKAEGHLLAFLKQRRDEPPQCAASFQLALAEVGLGKYADAARRLSTVPGKEECEHLLESSVLALAVSFLNLDQPSIAAEELRSFFERRASSTPAPDLRLALASALFRTKQLEEAQGILAELSKDEETVGKWPQIIYYDGLCLFLSSQYARAGEKFKRFIARGEPVRLIPLADYLEASSLMRAGKLAEAVGRYESFSEKWPDNTLAASALYRGGMAALALDRYGKASSLLERAVKKYPSAPTLPPARYFLGISRLKSGDPGGAAGPFRILSHDNPGFRLSDRAAFASGWIEFELGNHEAAGSIFSRLPSRFPHTRLADRARFFTSASYYKRGLFGVAGEEFQKIPVLFPDSPLGGEAMLWAGKCEEKMNHPRNALALYHGALQQNQGPEIRAQTIYALAWTRLALADREGAAASFGGLLGGRPRSALAEQARFWKGRLDYADGRWKPAMESLLELYRRSPESALADDALFFAARAAYNSSAYARAIELFETLTRTLPQSPLIEQAEIEAAQCMIEAGKADLAARKFERFIENNLDSPLRPLALYYMGRALQRAGNFEGAIEQYKAGGGGETTELGARARFAIAECLAELDRSTEAVAELIEITRGGFPAGWAERAHLQLARLLERDNRPEEARQVYGAIAAEYGDDAAGIVALKAVERLDAQFWKTAAH